MLLKSAIFIYAAAGNLLLKDSGAQLKLLLHIFTEAISLTATDKKLTVPVQTLKRKCMMSPSLTTYSFPSIAIFPASRHACSEPSRT